MARPVPKTLTFLGGAETVTGSKFLLNLGDRRIMVDAGMFQGDKQWRQRNWEKFPVDPASLEGVLLTHAHMDHSGYLPALVRKGFRGKIWATEGTIRLAEIVLRDAGFLQERDAQYAAQGGWSKHEPPLPLYTVADVEATLPLFEPLPIATDIDMGGRLTAHLSRAGHILGSASARLQLENTTIVFSGDIGRHDHPVLKSRVVPQGARYVVVESTYGDREHPEPDGPPHEAFAAAIRRTVARGGSILVPAFAVDRTEVILKALDEMIDHDRIPPVPIYFNSPMGTAALQVYQDENLRYELRDDIELTDFAHLPNLREVRSVEESTRLNDPKVPSIIISSSGMATGGRVLHHLKHMLPDHRNTVVLTGFQAAGTRGRALQDGVKQLKMHGVYVPVRAEVIMDDQFSVHADASDLIDWLAALDPAPSTIFCAHGEAGPAQALVDKIHDELGLSAVVPRYGEIVRID